MGRAPCCSKVGLHRGPWSPREDTLLIKYIQAHGEGNWRSMPKKAGLLRCGKSCRLRWMNYLRPDIKRGNITADEDDVIIRMHSLLGNRWSLIAGRLPGRTDNEIKNYWNTHLRKRLTSQGIHPNTHKKLPHRPPQQKQNKRQRKKDITTTTSNKFAKLLEPEKSNIYLPKPVRLTSSLPRNNSFNFNYQEGETTGLSAEGNSWCNFKEISFLDGNVDHDFVNCSDLEFLKILEPTNNSNLEKLYDEYLQLLKSDDNQIQFDSSAESLSL